MTDLATFTAAALDQAGDGVIAIDRDGIIRVWSKACEAMFGHTAAEAIGQDVKIIIPPRLAEAHDRGFFGAMERGHLASDGRPRRTKGVRKDGSNVYVTMTFAMIVDADGAAIGSVAVAREDVREG
ncbi:PAS domain-containing protein [Propioniciclava tarda]|uniref:PAS domain S-box protein n=1 Tax=Propioniciclava tarda TaxID=433330 RepID=A0A4Q9KPX0_PROTD|nr:PAS domain S-box protein [Propioniciclava tarda]TBT95929.1 PAS domain S-box protein [Propioniciclava tarda]SMO41584.1 PAS domain S-box-containing protein [Propioniciclava tarda]HOA90089.1 PAS domain S-box protein [Propioniciclava tarda]HQA32116.1 PAS domain S-box protein [Propioniciclava tarda]